MPKPDAEWEQMVDSSKTPIALFAYNRPQYLRLALEALARCDHLDDCELHIFCDGAKSANQIAAVQSTREVAREWAARLGAVVVERPGNLGLARSIVTGVTDLCKQYGRVIVIEDDLAVSPDFLCFMLAALERYQDKPQVYQISGYMYPVIPPPKPDAFFLPLTSSWGWATWERAWRIFDWNVPGAREKLADPQFRQRFDLDASYPFSVMLRRTLEKRVDSWGILWRWATFQVDALVLYPRRTLVRNFGFDGSGTHGGVQWEPVQSAVNNLPERVFAQPLLLPERVSIDQEAFEQVKLLLRGHHLFRKDPLFIRVLRRARRLARSMPFHALT